MLVAVDSEQLENFKQNTQTRVAMLDTRDLAVSQAPKNAISTFNFVLVHRNNATAHAKNSFLEKAPGLIKRKCLEI